MTVPARTFYSLARMIKEQGAGLWADHISDDLPRSCTEAAAFRACRQETEKACEWATLIIEAIMEHNAITDTDLWPRKPAHCDKRGKSQAGEKGKLNRLNLTNVINAGPPQFPGNHPFYSLGDVDEVVHLPCDELKAILESLKA